MKRKPQKDGGWDREKVQDGKNGKGNRENEGLKEGELDLNDGVNMTGGVLVLAHAVCIAPDFISSVIKTQLKSQPVHLHCALYSALCGQ